MPYIKAERRPKYDTEIDTIIATLRNQERADVKGDLNYIISRIVSVRMCQRTATGDTTPLLK